jgi:hypothetical protein
MRRVAVALLLVATSAGLLAPTSAHAASSGGPSGGTSWPCSIDLAPGSMGEHPPLARLATSEVRELALARPELARAARLRPGAVVKVQFYVETGTWSVSVSTRGGSPVLASVVVDDATGDVVDTCVLPLGDYPPRLTEREAIDAAVADRRVRREARAWGGVRELRAAGSIDGCCWEIDLFDPDRADGDPQRPVIRVDVQDASRTVTGVWTGYQVSWSMARGDREAFGGDVNTPVIWIGLLVLFMMVVVDWSRLRSWANADALALVAFAASWEAFVRGHLEWSVPLALAPLVWLLARMTWLFVRGVPLPRPATSPRTRLGRIARRPVPLMLLVVACVAIAGVRIGLTLDGGNVIDVGYAGVAGARLELEGDGPWGNMPADIGRGDTYGPANYLAYVPATRLLDDRDTDAFGTGLPAAQATAIAADLGCALLLALIGWRWISRRGGVLLALGWLTCPWTTLVVASGANDALVALALLAAFAALRHASLRGAFVAVAAMVKFPPIVVLVPMLHVGMRRRGRQALLVAAGASVALALGAAWITWRLDGGAFDDLRLFWDRTVAFQASRDSPFSPWGLYDIESAQFVARVLVVLGLVAAALRPRVRDAWQVAAGVAAALAAVQLLADHWFYLYLPWFVPFVLLVLIARRERLAPSGADMLRE